MKPVSPKRRVAQIAGKRELGRDGRHGAVERRIEAADLRQVRLCPGDGVDGCQITGLVQRRQRYQGIKRSQHLRVDAHRSDKARAAVDDPMPDGADHLTREMPVHTRTL